MAKTDPRLARLRPKIDRAGRELERLHRFVDKIRSNGEEPDIEWGTKVVIAQSLSNVYNGMEDVMSDIAKVVDGSLPSGETWHADLLDQMSVTLPGVRPALLDDVLMRDLLKLKGFRHVARHTYGIELRADLTLDILALMDKTLPAFAKAVEMIACQLGSASEPQADKEA